MDIALWKRVREFYASVDSKSGATVEELEVELMKRLTFAEQQTSRRILIKGSSVSSFSTTPIYNTYGSQQDVREKLVAVPEKEATFTFCTVCADFDASKARELSQARGPVSKTKSNNVLVSYDGSCQIMAKLPDICATQQRGCRSCTVLIMGIDRIYNCNELDMNLVSNDINYEDEDIEATIIFKNDHVLRLYLSRRSTHRAVESSGMSFFALPMLEFYTRPGVPKLFDSIGANMTKIYPGELDKNAPGGTARFVGLTTYPSEDSFEAIKGWIGECSHAHPVCTKARQTHGLYVPTRVLDVGAYGSDIIRLRQTGGSLAPYIALSHCWGPKGNSAIPKCTKNSIAKYQHGVSWKTLPRTFQDAVTVTRQLNIRYLWIDSLCIIQDSPADWAVECEQMASIYQGAVLVISATSSWESTGGCFHEGLRNIELELPSKTGEPAILCIRQAHDHSSFGQSAGRFIPRIDESSVSEYPSLPSPVFQRAWCYQERLLGCRVVHFADTELVFECLTAVNCECGALDNWKNEELRIARQLLAGVPIPEMNDHTTVLPGLPVYPTSPQPPLVYWLDIVQKYSKKELTVESDKLPAISGLAKRIQRLNMGPYYAGIFEFGLHYSLLWTSVSPEPDRRPTNYTAPSWSWASVNGEVEFLGPENGFHGLYEHEYCARVLEIHCVLESSHNPLGRIKSGFLRVEGYLASGMLSAPDGNSVHFLGHGVGHVKVGEFPLSFRYEADSQEESKDILQSGKTLTCLWFCSSRSNPVTKEMGCIFGLVLDRAKGSNTWKRVGLCETIDIKTFPTESSPRPRTTEWQTITII